MMPLDALADENGPSPGTGEGPSSGTSGSRGA
jgi:hypothetical protein